MKQNQILFIYLLLVIFFFFYISKIKNKRTLNYDQTKKYNNYYNINFIISYSLILKLFAFKIIKHA